MRIRRPTGLGASPLSDWNENSNGRDIAIALASAPPGMGCSIGVSTSTKPRSDSHRRISATVFERGFGDCKDKAYLFCEICRQLDAEAWPALVSTSDRGTIANWLPSPYAFNHVIASVRAGTNVWWVDPTRSHQRGLLHLRSLTDFGQCLATPAFERMGGAQLPRQL